jgi:hypothetical protein
MLTLKYHNSTIRTKIPFLGTKLLKSFSLFQDLLVFKPVFCNVWQGQADQILLQFKLLNFKCHFQLLLKKISDDIIPF